MAEIALDELMSRAKSQIENKKPNATIIAQLTSGKERRRPLHLQEVGRWQDSGVDLIVHVSVDFIWRESIAIGILRRTERSSSNPNSNPNPNLKPDTLEFGYQSEVLRNERITTPYDVRAQHRHGFYPSDDPRWLAEGCCAQCRQVSNWIDQPRSQALYCCVDHQVCPTVGDDTQEMAQAAVRESA